MNRQTRISTPFAGVLLTLAALPALCTHRNCKLDAETDRTFSCPSHGSTDPAGHVTEGPATRDLPVLTTATDGRGHLLVTVVS